MKSQRMTRQTKRLTVCRRRVFMSPLTVYIHKELKWLRYPGYAKPVLQLPIVAPREIVFRTLTTLKNAENFNVQN